MKRFKSIRSELNENEYSAIVTGNGNRSARTNDTISDVAGAKSLANLNAMLSAISRSTYLDPIEAFNKIRVRLNIALLDIEWNALKSHTGEETFTVPVRRYSRVDGVDAITGEIRMDGRANNPDGSKDLFLRVEVSLNADSLYVVDARLMTAMDSANVGESIDAEVSEETEQIDEVEVAEDVEQIDELSPSLLGRYVKKASYDARKNDWKAGRMFGASEKNKRKLKQEMPDRIKLLDKAGKREKGIEKAVNRLTKRG